MSSTCPHCGNEAPVLMRVDAGLKLRLQDAGGMASVPNEACESCHRDFVGQVSKGAQLRAESNAREQNRLLLWRNRVNLVKQAKQLMAQKSYSDAAVSYEKYLRVLEIVYEKKPGALTPDLFRNEARMPEITVIAGVYWDLMRIYDTSPRYGDRQMKAAEKLAEFAHFTPLYSNLVRQAEAQLKSAKNTAAFKYFLKKSNVARPRCFIATAAFDRRPCDTIDVLCRFRDEYLRERPWGRTAIVMYYRVSPPLADFLDRHPRLKPPTRRILSSLATRVVVKFILNPPPEL